MKSDGSYEHVDRRGKETVNSQLTFCNEAVAAAKKQKGDKIASRVFIPEESSSQIV